MVDKEKLSRYKLFIGLSSEELESVTATCREVDYKTDEVIYKELDDTGTDFFIILEGEVNVKIKAFETHDPKGVDFNIATLREGEIFGEISFLEKKSRSACLTAIKDVKVIGINNQNLNELFEVNKNIGYVMMRNLAAILASKLKDTNAKYAGESNWRMRKIVR